MKLRSAVLIAAMGLPLMLGGCFTGQGPGGAAGVRAERAKGSLEAQLAAGQAYLAAEQPNDAYAVFRRAAALDGSSYEAQMGLARACAELGDIKVGVNAAEAAAELQPGNPEPLQVAGRTCLAAHELVKAEKYFEDALDLDPKSSDTWRDLGEARFLGRAFGGSVTALGKARALAPDDADIRGKLGAAHHAAGDPETAIASYRKAVGLDPTNALYPRALAWLLLEEGMALSEARQMAKKSDDLERGNGDALVAAAIALLFQGHTDDAISELRQCIQKANRNGDAYVFLAEALIRRGKRDDFEQAVEALEFVERAGLRTRPLSQSRIPGLVAKIKEARATSGTVTAE